MIERHECWTSGWECLTNDPLARQMSFKTSMNVINGPAISDEKGRSYSTRDMTDSFVEILEDLFDPERQLFPPDIASRRF